MALQNNLRKQVDLPVWEWARFAPAVSAAASCTCAADNSTFHPNHGRYIYYMISNTAFWRYDTWTDTYLQLSSAPIALSTWASMKFSGAMGFEGWVLAATSNTITIPAYSSQTLKTYDVRIIGGTGMGQRRIITAVAEPTTYDTGVATAVANALGGITITDSTKNWTVNQWAGYQLRISFGSGIGQVRRILYNSATVITLADSTITSQNNWANPNIFSPAISATAGSQSIYTIEASVVTVDSNWATTPDVTSQFRVESGLIILASGAAATPFYTLQYYDIASDTWYLRTQNSNNVAVVGTDGTIERCTENSTIWDRGGATSGTVTTLVDSTKSWTVNKWAGYYVRIFSGTAEGQLRQIVSNTATTLTWTTSGTAPDATSQYLIDGFDSGTASSGSTTTLVDSTKSWAVNRWANYSVRFTFGTGKGEIMQIASNTATTLTFLRPLPTAPDSTTTYNIQGDIDKIYMMLGGNAATLIHNNDVDLASYGRTLDWGVAANAVVVYSTFATGVTKNIAIASATHVGTTANIVTAFPHCLKVGMSVTVKGMTDSNYNTTATITAVPTTTSFLYTMAGTPAADTLAGAQSTTTLCDKSKSWTVNQWAGYQATMTTTALTAATGVATGQVVQILSNTADTLTFVAAATAPLVGVSRYVLTPRSTPGMLDNGLATGTQSTTLLTDTNKTGNMNVSISSGSTTLTVTAVTFTASFATNQMTITSAPSSGVIAIGNIISSSGVNPVTTITSLSSGTANTNGAVYNLSTTPGTISAQSVSALPGGFISPGMTVNQNGSSGATASFATNVMTLVTIPTSGAVAIGQTVVSAGVAAGTTIVALASGTMNVAASTYTLSTTPGTITTQAMATANGTGSSAGATASFATNVMTLTAIATTGAIAVGQIVTGVSIPVGTTITGLLTGSLGAVSSTYSLSTVTGTISSEAITTTSIPVGTVIASQLTSTATGGVFGSIGTYTLSEPAVVTLTNATLNYAWTVNAFAGRKCKLIGGTGQSQEFTINSNTANTLAMTAITAAPVTTATSYVILQQPVRGLGIDLEWAFGLSVAANNGKFMIIARGGATVGFDRLDITTDSWILMPISPQIETLTTGSMYAYDGADRLYFTKEMTQRVYYIDINNNTVHGAGIYPYLAGTTAILGNRMEIFTTTDGLKYLWLNRHSQVECFKQLLFY